MLTGDSGQCQALQYVSLDPKIEWNVAGTLTEVFND